MSRKPQIRLSDEQRETVAANIGLAYWVARNRCKGIGPDEAESLCHEALCQAVYHWEPEKGKLSTLLMKWAKDMLLTARRDAMSSVIHVPQKAHTNAKVIHIGDHQPVQPEFETIEYQPIWAAIDRLKPRRRDILTRIAMGGYPAEIARDMGFTREYIRREAMRAYEQVRRYMNSAKEKS